MAAPKNPTTLELGAPAKGEAPLSSWSEGPTKQSIVDFVRGVTTAGSPQFVKPEERIAVFDNDGTLWSAQPAYFQSAFVPWNSAHKHRPHAGKGSRICPLGY